MRNFTFCCDMIYTGRPIYGAEPVAGILVQIFIVKVKGKVLPVHNEALLH